MYSTSAVSTLIRDVVVAWLRLCSPRPHAMRTYASDVDLRIVFPGPCAGRRLGRRRGAERRVGHRCLSEHSERVSMGGRSRPRAFSRSAVRPGDFFAFPFLVGQKRGHPGPGTARYARRSHSLRPIGASQRSPRTVGDEISSDSTRSFVNRNHRHAPRYAW